jgi:hypothetical protein
VLGVRRWRELVIDREKWRGTVRQAKAHSGLYGQWKKKKFRIPWGVRGDAVGRGIALQADGLRVRFPMGSLAFCSYLTLKYSSGVDSASQRNEYQGYLLEGKGGRYLWLTNVPPSCVPTSWSPTGLSRPVMEYLYL